MNREQFKYEHQYWHWRKHRVKRALLRIFKDSFWADAYCYDKIRESNNLHERDFWNKVRQEISGCFIGKGSGTRENYNNPQS